MTSKYRNIENDVTFMGGGQTVTCLAQPVDFLSTIQNIKLDGKIFIFFKNNNFY